jgi:hypothetical protein
MDSCALQVDPGSKAALPKPKGAVLEWETAATTSDIHGLLNAKLVCVA